MNDKATIIIPYFGKLPGYIGYFLASCRFNPEFRWIILCDAKEYPDCPGNVHFEHLTLPQFEDLASKKLDFNITITDPYKICDFKPAFGLIFQDYLQDTALWGYGDLDMIFGRINHFVSAEYFDTYDIISFYPGFLSGPFCLFRNTDYVRNLFKSCKAYKRILQDPEHFAFDENIYHPEYGGISIMKMIEMLVFAAKKPWLLLTFREFRYQYQWHMKRRLAGKYSPIDMTDAVFNAHRHGKVNSVFLNFLLTDPYFERVKKQNWKIHWHDGKLTYNNPNKEIMAFHFQSNKSRTEFIITPLPETISNFTISPEGFSV